MAAALQHRSRLGGRRRRAVADVRLAAELEQFDEERDVTRDQWRPPISGDLHGQSGTVLLLRVIIDYHSATAEDRAVYGGNGYAGTCSIRSAPEVPPSPPEMFASKYWVGSYLLTTHRLVDGVLRKRLAQGIGVFASAAGGADELEEVFYVLLISSVWPRRWS